MPTSLTTLLVATALAALGFAAGAHAKEGQGAVGPNDIPEQLRARSDVKGLVFTMLNRLPNPPRAVKPAEFCSHYVATPASSGARAARARGWIVTGEAPLGPFTAVSFAGGFEPATSGTCFVQDGNVGIFRDDQLVAVAYAGRGSQQSLGKVSALEDGAVRVWSGDTLSQPLGDMRRESEGYLLHLGALAPFETFCSGRARVPNIYGMGIDKARRALMQAGWTPVPGNQDEDDRFGREKDLRKKGIVEVEGCSGTGFGFCAYGYKGSAGTLSVTTVGDDDLPTVSGYGATCS